MLKILDFQLLPSSPPSPLSSNPLSNLNQNPPSTLSPPAKNCHQPSGSIGYPEIRGKERKRRGRKADFGHLRDCVCSCLRKCVVISVENGCR